MSDRLPSLPLKARQHHPYRSLYAALLLQSFEDALAEAVSEDSTDGDDRSAALPRVAPVADSVMSKV